jgi:hypothetical protein
MFETMRLNNKNCECGIPLGFTEVRPAKTKLGDLISVQVNNFVVTFTTLVDHTIKAGDLIEIVSGGTLDSVFVGRHTITAVGSLNQNAANTFSFGLRTPDVTTTEVSGYVYTVPNIENSDSYVINFTKELSIPDNSDVVITPESYTIQGGNNFIPTTSVRISSLYTTSSKTIIKLSITNSFGKVLFTEYKQIVCSRSADSPCEIIAQKPIVPSFIYLNRQNNWTYKNNGFLIAQFIPDKNLNGYENIKIRLPKPADGILPSNTNFDRLIFTYDPLLGQSKGISKGQVKTVILENPISASLQKNISIDEKFNRFIVSFSGMSVQQLENLQIESLSPGETQTNRITLKDVGEVALYISEPQSIPSIMFLSWSDTNQVGYFFGQLLYDYHVLNNSDIVVTFKNNNIEYRISPFVTVEDLFNYDYSG